MFGVPSSCLHLWCNGTVRWYARLVRKGKLPCASGRAYVSQEAGTRTLYVEHGCGTAYMCMHMLYVNAGLAAAQRPSRQWHR